MYPIFFKDFCPDQISNLHNYNTRNCLNIRQIETRREFRKKWLRYDIIQKIKHTPNIIHDKVQTHSFKSFSNYIKKILYNFIFKYVQQCTVLFMPKFQYFPVVSYLLQFKNHYIFHMYIWLFLFKIVVCLNVLWWLFC